MKRILILSLALFLAAGGAWAAGRGVSCSHSQMAGYHGTIYGTCDGSGNGDGSGTGGGGCDGNADGGGNGTCDGSGSGCDGNGQGTGCGGNGDGGGCGGNLTAWSFLSDLLLNALRLR